MSATDKTPTKWNFTDMFSGDNDPKIEENRKITEQKTKQFVAMPQL